MTVKTQKTVKNLGGGRLWYHVLFGVIFATSLGSTSMLPLSRRTAKKKKEEEEAPLAGSGAEPQLKLNLVHFSLKI